MKCLRLFSLVLLFYLLVMFVGRVSLAQECKECTWTAGKTSVSDLSPEQKAKRLGIKLPPGYWEMWEMLPKFEPTKELSLPTRFDWRDSNVVTPVKDQRDCGSCWDFCAVGALEAMVRKYGEVEMDLSEQQILSCVTYGTGCDGGYPDQAYNHFKSPYGAIYEECMPYQADDEVPCTENSCEKWARISSYTTVSNNVTTIKQALLTYGPVSTLFAAPDTFSYYRGGCFNYAYFDLNHCMLLVGWDDTMCNGQGAWIVKNSWGTGWGVGGYAFIKYGSCMIGTGVEYPNYIYHRPYVRFENLGINDQAGGDGDSRAELGEVVRLDFTLKNLWSPLGNVNVTVSADTSGIMITDNYSYLGTLASGEIKDNSLDPMQFQVPTDFPPRRVYFTFHVEGDSGGGVIYTKDSTLEVLVGHDILLVDDDQGVDLYSNHESYYIAAFDSLKAVYDMWDKKENPDTAYNLSGFNAVIWFTGDHRDSVFSEADIESLKTFLNNSGRLFLTSQDAVEALSGSGNSLYQEFLTDYLHVGYRGNCSRYLVADYPGDEVGDTLWIYPGGVPGASNQTSKDDLVPDMQADTVLRYAESWFVPTDSVAAVKFGNDFFRVVVFGFGFEAINSNGTVFHGKLLSKPHFVMQRVLDWLKAPLPMISLISPNGGEIWDVGITHDIIWQSISFSDSVMIEYSINGGVDWLTIADTATNDGVYPWTIPNTPSNSCRVRVSDVANGIPSDTSDNHFSIVRYVPGDANADSVVDVADVVYLVNYLYRKGPAPSPMVAGDPSADCIVDVADVVYLVNYLFRGGPAPQEGCAPD